MSRQDNSDPLPFVQVDRAVEPSATLLAGHMKVTSQHALGSLIGFWKLCGDPRELERIVEKTPKGKEPAVVLSAEDVALRFQLASDHRVEPLVLARLGILEEVPEGFRVRGMSRFFDTIEARLQARRVAVAGGKASAAARKAANGTAQPRSASGSESGSAAVQPALEPSPNRSRTGVEPETEPHRTLEVRGQRSEGIVQRTEAEVPPIAAFEILSPDMEQIESWPKEDFWRAAELTRRARGFPPQKWPNPVTLSKWWGEARAIADVTTLAKAFTRFADDPHWSTRTPPAPFAGFMTQWNNFLPSRAA